MPDSAASADVRIKVFEDRRLVATFEMTRPTEIGRRQTNEPAPYARVVLDTHDRIILADLAETQVSRRYLMFEPQPGEKIRVTNESAKNSVPLLGNLRLGPGESMVLELPIACEVGTKVVRVYVSPPEELNLQTLQQPTCAPGQSNRNLPLRRSAVLGVGELQESSLLDWLQASMDVFQSAASSIEFLPKAAKAAVDLVGLDQAAVLTYQGDQWSVVTVQARDGEPPRDPWQASQTMLRRVLDERRTFFHVPRHDAELAASLVHVQSLVAAPFLDRHGQVLGVLYGERHTGGGIQGRPPIRELDAKLVELLAYGVASGLARIEQERQLIAERVRFEQFFTPELARMLEIRGDDMLAARDAQITVLFCDIKGFSRISAACGAALAIEWVCDVLSELSDCVAEQQGVLVDYSGDALEALWGAPLETAEHATLACRAALHMRGRLPAINDRWRERLGEETDIAIGIHSGPAKVGNIGSRRKYKYGALGTTVNLASRIQGATKYIGRSLLTSESTVAHVDPRSPSDLDFRRLCTIRTVNIASPITVYELREVADPSWIRLKRDYEQALRAFETGRFADAQAVLPSLLRDYPDDLPCQQLAQRLTDVPPNQTPFDAVWTLEGK